MKNSVVVFWFRRDLRLEDNVGLQKALTFGHKVLPVFIFDTEILSLLENTYDRRVDYIHQALNNINHQLKKYHSSLHTFWGKPYDVFKNLLQQFDVRAVYCNHDYEPHAIARDRRIKKMLEEQGIFFYDFKDQVIFEQSEIIKEDGNPYTVYTPYAKKWRAKLQAQNYTSVEMNLENLYQTTNSEIHSLTEIGFQKTDIVFQKPELNFTLIHQYDKYRDFPALDHTTHLSVALRFGTISIRECIAFALQHNDTWLSELIWREFFMQILYHFPHVVSASFKQQYELIQWRNNETEFKLWCQGKTGYPIVDAGMRQLNKTGFMHNRVRMIVASFLCKHLLINWRWGEAYFAEKLNDFDLAANNGNWQWAAGCGCDAAPYFRIFNPTSQTQKFDRDLNYIRTWYPEFDKEIYPPIVEHSFARQRALSVYGKAIKENNS